MATRRPYTTDKPLYDKIDEDSLPLVQFLKRLYDQRTAKEFYNYLGEMFDTLLDSKSILTDAFYLAFDEGQPVPGALVHPLSMSMLDFRDVAADERLRFTLGLFEDEDLTTPHPTATFSNATEGDIVFGSGDSVTEMKGSDTGAMTVDVNAVGPGPVYVGLVSTFGSAILSRKGALALSFS